MWSCGEGSHWGWCRLVVFYYIYSNTRRSARFLSGVRPTVGFLYFYSQLCSQLKRSTTNFDPAIVTDLHLRPLPVQLHFYLGKHRGSKGHYVHSHYTCSYGESRSPVFSPGSAGGRNGACARGRARGHAPPPSWVVRGEAGMGFTMSSTCMYERARTRTDR